MRAFANAVEIPPLDIVLQVLARAIETDSRNAAIGQNLFAVTGGELRELAKNAAILGRQSLRGGSGFLPPVWPVGLVAADRFASGFQ